MAAIRPHPLFANVREINKILGNSQGSSTGQVVVGGVNPKKITCHNLLVHGRMRFYDRMETSFVAMNGNTANTAIRFACNDKNTGFYSPAADRICIAIQGIPTTCFTSDGLVASKIRGSGGIIDFGGSTLTNFTVSQNPHSYTLIGTKVQTIGATTATALIVPLVDSSTSSSFELMIKIEYVDINDERNNGNYTFRIRAWSGVNTQSVPKISSQYDVTKYNTNALDDIKVKAEIAGTNINIQVTGIIDTTINWIAKCDIITIDSS